MFFLRNLIIVFLFVSFIDVANGWVTLASRFLVSNLTVKTTLNKLKNLGLSSGVQKVRFFVNRHGKQILMVAAVGSLLQELSDIQERQSYCYINHFGKTWCNIYRCSCSDYPDTRFYRITECVVTDPNIRDEYAYVDVVEVVRLTGSGQTYVGFVPYSGTYYSHNYRVHYMTIETLVPPCSEHSEYLDRVMNEQRDVRIRVFPNPSDFFILTL
jgi:hypothetical protein